MKLLKILCKADTSTASPTQASTQPETSTDTPIQSQTLPTPPTGTPGPTQPETSTESPIQSQTLPTPPSPSPSPAPTMPETEAPTEPETEASTEPETKAPTQPETQAPTEPETQAPTEPETESPTEPETQAPTEPETESRTEPETQAPTQPETQASTQPETQALTEPETQAPTDPETQAPTEPETQAPTEPTTQAATEPETKAPTQPETQAPTQPETQAQTEPETQAPTQAPIELGSTNNPPTRPTVCNIHCGEGVPDYDSCECIKVVGCEGYNEVDRMLMNITDVMNAAGQTTASIDDTIFLLKGKLADLAQYCFEGPIVVETVSDMISYIKTKIVELAYEIDEFTSTLLPIADCGIECTNNYFLNNRECFCYCKMDCNTAISVYNWGYCQCSAYEHANKIYNMKYDIMDFIKKVQSNLENTIIVHQYLETLYDSLESVETALSNLEHNFDTIDLDYYTSLIESYFNSFKNTSSNYDEWFSKTVRCSSSKCDPNTVLRKDCSCYGSVDTDSYFEILKIFDVLEGEIMRYPGPGSGPELQVFDERILNVRQMFQDLYTYWEDNDSYDQTTVDQLISYISDSVSTLRQDWDIYFSVNSIYCSVLKLNCDLKTTAIDLKYCECAPIDGYSELQDDASTLDTLMNEISSLAHSAKTELQTNL